MKLKCNSALHPRNLRERSPGWCRDAGYAHHTRSFRPGFLRGGRCGRRLRDACGSGEWFERGLASRRAATRREAKGGPTHELKRVAPGYLHILILTVKSRALLLPLPPPSRRAATLNARSALKGTAESRAFCFPLVPVRRFGVSR